MILPLAVALGTAVGVAGAEVGAGGLVAVGATGIAVGLAAAAMGAAGDVGPTLVGVGVGADAQPASTREMMTINANESTNIRVSFRIGSLPNRSQCGCPPLPAPPMGQLGGDCHFLTSFRETLTEPDTLQSDGVG